MSDESGLSLSDDPRINTTVTGINDVCSSYKPGIQYLGRYPPTSGLGSGVNSLDTPNTTFTYVISLNPDQLVDFERSHIRLVCRAYRTASAPLTPVGPIGLNYDPANPVNQQVQVTINPYVTDLFDVCDLTVSGQNVEHNQFAYLRMRALTPLIPKENLEKYYSDCYFLPFEDKPYYYALAGTSGTANDLTEFPGYGAAENYVSPARARGLSLVSKNTEDDALTGLEIVEFTKRVPLSFLFAFGEKNLMPGSTSLNMSLQMNLTRMLTQIGANPANTSSARFEITQADLYVYGYRMQTKIQELYDTPFDILVNDTTYVTAQGISSTNFNYSGSLPPMCNMIVAEFFCENPNIVASRGLGASYLPSDRARLLVSLDGQQYPPITLNLRTPTIRPAKPTTATGTSGSGTEIFRANSDDSFIWFEAYNFAKSLGNAGLQAANINGVLFDKDAFGSSQFRMYILVNAIPGAVSIDNRAISFTMSLDFDGTLVPSHVTGGSIGDRRHTMALTYFSTSMLRWAPEMRSFVPRLRTT